MEQRARLARAFFAWQARALSDLEELARTVGLDLLTNEPSTGRSAPRRPRRSWPRSPGRSTTTAAADRSPWPPGIGLCTTSVAAVTTPVPTNAFFGADYPEANVRAPT